MGAVESAARTGRAKTSTTAARSSRRHTQSSVMSKSADAGRRIARSEGGCGQREMEERGRVHRSGGLIAHPEAFENPNRAHIRRIGRRNDARQAERLESVAQDSTGGFGGEAAPPVPWCQAIEQLDIVARLRRTQAAKSAEVCGCRQPNRPQAEATRGETHQTGVDNRRGPCVRNQLII